MSFQSKVYYEGDGVETDYTVTFPYISTSHVRVYVDNILQLTTLNYVWSGASTIQFNDAPADGSAIEIRRVTSPNNTLVDFVDGSTLRATDLDNAYLHNFYLSQEYADGYNELINQALVSVATGAGIVETETDEVIAALVNEMLADANAANLQARIADIDANAEAILTLTSTVNDNYASIAVTAVTVADIEDDVLTLYAKYGVTLDVNGYVTGFAQNNDGTTGSFVIVADKFAVVQPGTFDQKIYWDGVSETLQIDGDLIVSGTLNGTAITPLSITGGLIGNGEIDTDQLNAGAVTAVKISANAVTAEKINVANLSAVSADMGSITAGTITLDTSGYIRGGQTAFNTGTGFFLGYDTDAYKFSIGDGSTNYMTWDGSQLTIKGNLIVGEYEQSDNIILSATTERTSAQPDQSYETLKEFEIDKDGDVRVTVDYKHGAFTGTVTTPCNWRVQVNGVTDTTWGSSTQTTYTTRTINLTGLSAGDNITIDAAGGLRNFGGEPLDVTAYVQNAYVKADVVIDPGGTVVTD